MTQYKYILFYTTIDTYRDEIIGKIEITLKQKINMNILIKLQEDINEKFNYKNTFITDYKFLRRIKGNYY